MSRSDTFVLVHGAWIGGWCWREVADILRAEGHRVFTPTLTGLGEREHLLSPDINLTTHIMDVVNLIKWEELTDIVLVGHSYGGMVITGVAEKVPAGTIRSIVYLDAFFPDDGQSLADIVGEEAAQQVYGDADPIPPIVALAGDDKVLAEMMATKCTPHPRASKFERLHLTGARERIPLKTFVVATKAGGMHNATVERLQSDPSWRIEEIGCGHDTMIEMPEETAATLVRASQG